MKTEELNFYKKLQLRLEKTKNMLNSNDLRLNMPYFNSDLLNLTKNVFKNNLIRINALNKNSIIKNKTIVEKPKLYGKLIKINAISMIPKINLIENNDSNNNFIHKKKNSLQYIAKDAVEKFNYNKLSNKKIRYKNNKYFNQSQLNQYNYNNRIIAPSLRKTHIFLLPNELNIKNNFQIEKVENFSNHYQKLIPKRIRTINYEKLYPKQNLFIENNKNYIMNEIKLSKFELTPLNNKQYINRPIHTFIQHQKNKINQNLQLKNILLNKNEKKQPELSYKILKNQNLASLNGLLNCCEQQAPNCKHLCSKNVSKEEVQINFFFKIANFTK